MASKPKGRLFVGLAVQTTALSAAGISTGSASREGPAAPTFMGGTTLIMDSVGGSAEVRCHAYSTISSAAGERHGTGKVNGDP